MFTILIASTLALVAPQPPAAPPAGTQPQDRAAGQADKAGQPGQADKALDGQWTIICLEKNGQPMPEAKNMTVKCEGNTITCSAKDGKPAMTLKVVFGQNGTIRVTEQNATGTQPAEAGKPIDTAGRDPAAMGTKSGVYVLTSEFLAVCIHDDARGASDRNGGRGADATPAVDGGRPGAEGGRTGADREGAANGGNPTAKSYCSIVLKRDGAAPAK